MDDKIRELTEKLLKEGVGKGEAEAARIVADAKKVADAILAEAKKNGEEVIAKARSGAEEFRAKTESELRLSATQAMSAFKQALATAVTAKIVQESVGPSLMDPGTVAGFVRTIFENWRATEGRSVDLICLLPEARRSEFEAAAQKALSHVLGQGLDVRFSDRIKGGFRIGPKDGSFVVSLTDEDFKSFFQAYLRPRAKAFLFGE